MSFDELKSPIQIVVVEFDKAKLHTITPIEIPRFQPLDTLKADLSSIEKQLKNHDTYLGEKPIWICIEVDIRDYLSDLQQRIQTMTEDVNVETLQLRRSRKPGITKRSSVDLRKIIPCGKFW